MKDPKAYVVQYAAEGNTGADTRWATVKGPWPHRNCVEYLARYLTNVKRNWGSKTASEATRDHRIVVDPDRLPTDLDLLAWASEDEVLRGALSVECYHVKPTMVPYGDTMVELPQDEACEQCTTDALLAAAERAWEDGEADWAPSPSPVDGFPYVVRVPSI